MLFIIVIKLFTKNYFYIYSFNYFFLDNYIFNFFIINMAKKIPLKKYKPKSDALKVPKTINEDTKTFLNKYAASEASRLRNNSQISQEVKSLIGKNLIQSGYVYYPGSGGCYKPHGIIFKKKKEGCITQSNKPRKYIKNEDGLKPYDSYAVSKYCKEGGDPKKCKKSIGALINSHRYAKTYQKNNKMYDKLKTYIEKAASGFKAYYKGKQDKNINEWVSKRYNAKKKFFEVLKKKKFFPPHFAQYENQSGPLK